MQLKLILAVHFSAPPAPQLLPTPLQHASKFVEPPSFLWLFAPSSPHAMLLDVVFQELSLLSKAFASLSTAFYSLSLTLYLFISSLSILFLSFS
jgi:hypothetical protein